jgi:methionyl-tRNA formyltransferase
MLKEKQEINRIVILTLESFCSGPALTKFITKYNNRISLVCVSERYGGKYGSFWQQLKQNFYRSGFTFVNYLSFNLIYYKPFVYIGGFLNKVLGRKKKVYTIKQLCKKYNIPLIKTLEVKDAETIKQIKSIKPDLIISAYFDHLINQDIIDIPLHGVINIHTAPLPEYRGPFPPLWPALHGKKGGQVTVHYVDDFFDEGDIIAQKDVEFGKKESILSMDSRFMMVGIDALIDVLDKMERGKIETRTQGEGSYYSYPNRNDLKNLKKHGVKLYSVKDYIKKFF